MGGIIETNQGWRYPLPRLKEGESPLVAPGTPLAVIGLWIAAIQSRFSPDNLGVDLSYNPEGTGWNTFDAAGEPRPRESLPWVWDADLAPGSECIPDGDQTKLLIDAGFNSDSSTRNYRPAIYVDRGDVTPQQVVIDNKAGEQLETDEKAYFAIANIPIHILCEAEVPAESSLIADTVWFFVLATRNIFKDSFGFYDISIPVLGKTAPSEHDKEVWDTMVQFTVTIELRWGTRPIAPLLRELGLRLSNMEDPQLYYHQIALRESGS